MNGSGTILAFDFGDARIGLARADNYARLPEPLGSLATADHAGLEKIINDLKPDRLIVGLPRNLEGNDTPQTTKARAFAHQLEKFGIAITLQDEALSTVSAAQRSNGSRRPVDIDSMAAVVILEDYLTENS